MEALAATFFTSAAGTTGLAGATAVTTATGALAGSGSVALATGAIGAPVIGGTLAAPGLLSSGGIFGAISTSDLILGGLSGFSALSSIAAGQAGKTAAEEGALFEEFGAKQEILKGRREALSILEAEQDALEQNIVDIAASGITGQGSAKAAQEAIISKAEFETGITRTTAELNAEARRAKARQLRTEGKSGTLTGTASAAGQAAGFFLRRTRRGG
jgi:hypothetical protein